MIFAWYKNLNISFFRFVTMDAFDRRTDRILIARPRLRSTQRGKNDSDEECDENIFR